MDSPVSDFFGSALMCVRFIHVVLCVRSLFFPVAEHYAIVWIFHNLSILLLSCYQIWPADTHLLSKTCWGIKYTCLHTSKVNNFMSFDTCVHLWNHHSSQESDHTHHLFVSFWMDEWSLSARKTWRKEMAWWVKWMNECLEGASPWYSFLSPFWMHLPCYLLK